MKEKMIGLTRIMIMGIALGVLGTFLVYWQFPQFLCYTVHDTSQSDLYQKISHEMEPGTNLVEHFVPRNKYLTAVRIHVKREENEGEEDIIIGRLLNAEKQVLAESSFRPQDEFFEFKFHKWVNTTKEYQMEIIFPKENSHAITTTFGPSDIGPSEHRALYIGDVCSEETIYAEYIYGSYSRKLLAFWFLIFFLGGIMIGDALFCKKNQKN